MIKLPPSEDIAGPVGRLETLVLSPEAEPTAIALVAHPNPLHGGTHLNKVVQTLAKAFVKQGCVAYCPNLRGVGQSEGVHDYGIGETEDMLAVAAHARARHGDLPLVLAGFSFGSFVQSRAQVLLQPRQLYLIGPATSKYEYGDVPADTIIIHGEEDDVAPLAAVFDWARPRQLAVIVIPGVGHFFHGRLPQLQQWVLATWRG